LESSVNIIVHLGACSLVQGGQKSKPLPNHQQIVLKPANEIDFIVKLMLG